MFALPVKDTQLAFAYLCGGMVFITRREHFNAAHKVWRPDWSDEKNTEVFGKCANPNWHGHNYELYVTVKGLPSLETGFVIDLKVLSSMIKTHVTDVVDHKNLNLDVWFMENQIASTENLAIGIFKVLAPVIQHQGCQLHSVRLHETENNFVEYFGD